MTHKSILALLALATISTATAREITADEALQRLNGASDVPSAVKARNVATSVNAQTIYTPDNNSPALYLFRQDEQLLVLPADDRVKPLLGYTDAPSEGQMPEQLQWWLNEYARQIQYLQQQPEHGTGLYITRPSRAESSAKAPIAPMITTRWNQGTPFNNQCPMVDGQRSVTGCVATAAAQIMKYFNYPDKGTGSLTYVDENNNTYSINFASKSFDWDNMIDNYNATYTATQASAVAYLMKACGYACQMSYTASESGASSEDMANGLTTYFKYNSALRILDRDQYPLAQWQDMIYENLQTVGPLYYSGDDRSAGHAFVCDGYSEDGYFHFNWGWGGVYDGYFQLTALLPEGQGIGGNAGGFNFGQQVIFNITTPDGATIDLPEDNSPITLCGGLTAEKYNANAITISSTQADTYGVAFYNSTDETHDFEFRLKAINTSTGQEFLQSSGQSVSGLPSGYGYKQFSIQLSLVKGTYKVYPVAQVDGQGDWIEFATSSISDANYCIVNVGSTGNITSVTSDGENTPDISDLQLESDLYWGSPFKFSFLIENNGDSEFYTGVYPAIFTISDNTATLLAQGAPTAFDMLPGESQDVTLVSSMTVATSSFSGDAYFGLIDVYTDAILDYIAVNVNGKANEPTLTSTKFQFIGDTSQADANNLQFQCGVKCTNGYYANKISVYIVPTNYGAVLTTLNSTDTYFLSEGDTAETTISGAFADGQPGTSYVAILGFVKDGYVQILDTITFTIGSFSGIENIQANNSASVSIATDRSTLYVTAPATIAKIEAYSLDGRTIALDADINNNAATASLATMPGGINLIKITLTDGTCVIRKIAK